MPKLLHIGDMADGVIEDTTDVLMVTGTGVENDLLTPSLKLMPKLNHTGDMDIADIMVDMDIHMVMQDTITLENDLLMPNQNQKQKPSHGMDMDIAVMDMDIVHTDIGVKPSYHYYQSYLRNAL